VSPAIASRCGTQYRIHKATLVSTNAIVFEEHLRFIANRRCQQSGIDPLFDKADNPFPRMAEMIDLKKEKNLFETRLTLLRVKRSRVSDEGSALVGLAKTDNARRSVATWVRTGVQAPTHNPPLR